MLVTSECEFCKGHIGFESAEFEPGVRVSCPHCSKRTLLFIRTSPASPNPTWVALAAAAEALPTTTPKPVLTPTSPAPPAASSDFDNSTVAIPATTVLIELVALAALSVWNPFAALLSIPVFASVLFIVCYVRPLRREEISQLADKRRLKQIKAYYHFVQGEASVNLDFKKAMAASGSYYNIRTRLTEFPSIAAALLKYKKHDWIIVGFEREQIVDCLWLNKGPNNSEVAPRLGFTGIVDHARSGKHTSVIVVHNHPNPNPARFSMLLASAQDNLSAKALECVLLPSSLNLLEFVCERGRFHEYHRAGAPSFIPIQDIASALILENNVGLARNLQLHLERLF